MAYISMTVDGKKYEYSGNSVEVVNGVVIVDGKVVETIGKNGHIKGDDLEGPPPERKLSPWFSIPVALLLLAMNLLLLLLAGPWFLNKSWGLIVGPFFFVGLGTLVFWTFLKIHRHTDWS